MANHAAASLLVTLAVCVAVVLGRRHGSPPFTATGRRELQEQTKLQACANITRRQRVHFPQTLLRDFAGHDTLYSGYVNVTDKDFLFYVFAEARKGAPADAPLIVWSNGGPGCSAMEGLTTEHGPLLLKGAKGLADAFAGRLSHNSWAWNNQAHVIYVDQPRYVGYSCGTGKPVTSSTEAAADMVTFMRGWLSSFPEHAGRDIILASESYGGRYVSSWSKAFLDFNAGPEGAGNPLRIAGLLIGNGFFAGDWQDSFLPIFAEQERLIDGRGMMCRADALQEINSALSYEPNCYDYRLKGLSCCGCGCYDYRAWSAWHLRCEVVEALHAADGAAEKAFGGCSAGCIESEAYDHFDKGVDVNIYKNFIGEALAKQIPVTLYYGMRDTVCDYAGGWAFAHSVQWSGAEAFKNTVLEDLLMAGVAVGQTKSSSGFTWFQVTDTGHMVPADDPAVGSLIAQHAISTRLRWYSGNRALGVLNGAVQEKVDLAPDMHPGASVTSTTVAAGAFAMLGFGLFLARHQASKSHQVLLTEEEEEGESS